ncbi:protein FAM200B isoform X3 [Ursus maritimus]|uniref:Protein FAM200B isoform X3 n=1 Tax=Ursus maritimus TaxID=29073 RepID=A0A8M1FEX9_URSMA|nr:protein FAM200B isoform X7 [Ursus arctos]XP_040480815.1 protein FAM200B isoform X3 [Ursus maritimus]
MGGRAESPLDGRNGRLAALGWRKRKNEVKYAEACSSSTPGSRNVNSDNMEKNIDSTLQSSTSFEPHFKKKKEKPHSFPLFWLCSGNWYHLVSLSPNSLYMSASYAAFWNFL